MVTAWPQALQAVEFVAFGVERGAAPLIYEGCFCMDTQNCRLVSVNVPESIGRRAFEELRQQVPDDIRLVWESATAALSQCDLLILPVRQEGLDAAVGEICRLRARYLVSNVIAVCAGLQSEQIAA